MLVVTDEFSKFAQEYPIPDQRASTVARVLTEKWFYVYGVPKCIHSDQGKSFEGDLLKRLCHLYGIEKSRTTPYHSEGNGQCEQCNRTLHDLLLRRRKENGCNTYFKCFMRTTPRNINLQVTRPTNLCLVRRRSCLWTSYWVHHKDNPCPGQHMILDEHQNRFSSVDLHAKEQLQQAAEWRNRRYQPTVTSLLAPGTLVYRKSHPIGCHKIQDVWDPIVHILVKSMDGEGRFYKICPRDGTGPERNLNRSELRVLPTATTSTLLMTQNQPVPDPGLASDPPPQLSPNAMDGDSDSEGILLTMVPEQRQSQAPSPTFEPVNQIMSTASHTSDTPSVACYVNENGPSNDIDMMTTAQTRPKGSTAGHHNNPFHLPRSVNQTLSTSGQMSQASHVQVVFRPWL